MRRAAVGIVAALAWLGCQPDAPPSAEEAATGPASAPRPSVAPAATESPARAGARDASTASVDVADRPATEAPDDAAGGDGARAESTGGVSEEECDAACENALAITLRELPVEAADVRTAVVRALQDECPRSCRERGTPEGVACIARAKEGADLMVCPP